MIVAGMARFTNDEKLAGDRSDGAVDGWHGSRLPALCGSNQLYFAATLRAPWFGELRQTITTV